MTPRLFVLSAAILVWVNALPYLSRLSRGTEWVSQYLPDEGFLLVGLLFIHGCFSLPAIPLIRSIQTIKKLDLPWILAFVAVTVLTWLFHEDYDLSADAQAATGLVVIPLFTMGLAYLIMTLGRKLPRLPLDLQRARKFREWEPRKRESAAYRQGWLAFQNRLDTTDNPYRGGDSKHNDWADGWDGACDSRKQMFGDSF
jgi:hypothetical protein